MKVVIEQDLDPCVSPREWSNLGIMVAFHRRYNLGDETDLKSSMFEGWDDLEEHLRREEGAAVILPLYLYDHSGITMNTTGFSCGWDSGQVGFIYVTKKAILAEYTSCRRLTKKLHERVEKQLLDEVKAYDLYLTGDVWGYRILDDDGEEVDACWGIYDRDYAEAMGNEALKDAQMPLYEELMREKIITKAF
jgi:hypothetical protein